MADIKITELGAIPELSGGDVLPIVDATDTTTKKVSVTQLAALAAAQVDTTNVTAAGALMDSEVDADIKTLSLPANTTITTFGASLVDDATAADARTTLQLGNAATLTVDADLATFAVPASTTISAFGATLVDDADQATARTTLGLGTAATTAATDYATAAQGTTADGAIAKSLVDAKGDLIVATADNTPARLAVGATNDHVLTVDSSTATGLKWAAAAAGGGYFNRPLISYALPGYGFTGGIGTQALNGNWTYYQPFILAQAATLSTFSISVQATGAGAAASLAIYTGDDDGTNIALVSDLGTVDISGTGLKTKTSLALSLSPKLYYARLITNGTATLHMALYPSPTITAVTGGQEVARILGNTGTTYNATAPSTGATASNVVNANNAGYCWAFMTWA